MNNKKLKLVSIIISLFTYFIVIFSTNTFANKAREHSPAVASSMPATGAKVFVFDPRHSHWAVYEHGKIIRSGRAAGGKRHCADIHRPCLTPVGTFRIYSKQGPNFTSSIYPLPHGGASMPWAMFFHKGYAIHGSNEVPNHPVSHGCIRVHPSDASWLSHNLPVGTKVIVRSY